jgi:putative flippase GtrA
MTKPNSAKSCIVVPCYNEESRFDAEAFGRYLDATTDVSFVLVNDGSTDGTLGVLEGLASKYPERVRTLDVQPNGGKSEAVRRGMQLAISDREYDYAGFWDADLATPLESIRTFVDVLDRLPNVEIVMGARVALLGRRIDRKATRHYSGRLFATAASLVLSLPVYDTQCGAKLFRANRACSVLFASPFGSRWIFDVEIIARYLRNRPGNALGIYELPLDRWEDVGESKVRFKDFVRAIGEMMSIYRRYRLQGEQRFLVRLFASPFLRYLIVGGLGTVVHFALLAAVVAFAHGTPFTGTMVGATAGAFLNYILNYHVTFASQQQHRTALPRFLTVALTGMLINGFIVKVATERLGIYYLTAQLIATATVLVFGFLLNRAWTFAEAEVEDGREADLGVDAPSPHRSGPRRIRAPEGTAAEPPESQPSKIAQ